MRCKKMRHLNIERICPKCGKKLEGVLRKPNYGITDKLFMRGRSGWWRCTNDKCDVIEVHYNRQLEMDAIHYDMKYENIETILKMD